MASSINANNIDGTYPVAGVDNDSQGFRTNFTNIKNNFLNAKSELEDLQSKVLLKSALTAVGGSLDNSMSYAKLSGAQILNFSETEIDLGSVSGPISLDHSAAHYHKVTPTGSISASFSSWPTSGQVGRIRLKVVLNSTAYTLTLPSAVNMGTSTIDGYASNVITFPGTGTYYFEFITDDAGSNIHIQDLTRPRKSTANSSIWGNSAVASYKYFDYSNVTSGFSATVNSTLILDSTAALTGGTITFPSSPADGQVVNIVSNNSIGLLTLTVPTGTIASGKVSSMAANSHVSYQYVAGPQKWFLVSEHVQNFTRSNVATTGSTTQATEITALSSSGTITAQTIYFPPATLARNGETITIASNVAVTTLTLTSNGATIAGALSSIAANGFGKWVYSTPELRWFRIG
jgi:hypothetical protein